MNSALCSETLAAWRQSVAELTDWLVGPQAAGAALARADRGDPLTIAAEITAAQAEAVTQGALDRWFAVLGNALTVRIESRAVDEAWEAEHARHDGAALGRFLAEAGQLSAPGLTASFVVRKGELAARLALPGVAPADRVRLYLTAEGLRQLLAKLTPETFESTFLAGAAADERLLLLVADAPGVLVGPALAVVGVPNCDDWAGFTERTGPTADAVRKRMRELTSWPGRDRRLTPDAFVLTTRTGLEKIAAELIRLQNRLVVPYLANRSGGGSDEYLFEGERTAAVTLGDQRNSIDLHRFYAWIYHDPEAARTKLEIARRVLAAGLRGETAETFAALIRGCASFQNDAEFQLRLLLDKNLSASFDLRQKIEDTIAGYVGQVRAGIESLTQDVVDNVYRTAGLLVGVAIAVLLDPDRKLWVVWLGGGLYALYLLFILQFYLAKRYEQFRRQKEVFRQRFDQHDALGFGVLPPVLLAQRREQIRRQNRTFEETYRQVRGLYWAFLAVTVLLVGIWTVQDRRGAAGGGRTAAPPVQATP
jgi:hypothetical protein